MEKTTPIEEQLKAIYNLQIIDTKLDKLQNIRGELPMEVNDLEDEIEGLKTRIENIDFAVEELKQKIELKKVSINDANTLLLKYESQQMHVKNNREYVAISKEIELQKLEIMAAEKKIKEFKSEIDDKEAQKKAALAELEEKKNDLVEKEQELNDIIEETKVEENDSLTEKEEADKSIDERLLKAYNKVRTTYQNRLAVVSIERDSCGGCYSQVPPQRQLDVKMHMKIIACENCGRILIDPELADVDFDVPPDADIPTVLDTFLETVGISATHLDGYSDFVYNLCEYDGEVGIKTSAAAIQQRLPIELLPADVVDVYAKARPPEVRALQILNAGSSSKFNIADWGARASNFYQNSRPLGLYLGLRFEFWKINYDPLEKIMQKLC